MFKRHHRQINNNWPLNNLIIFLANENSDRLQFSLFKILTVGFAYRPPDKLKSGVFITQRDKGFAFTV